MISLEKSSPSVVKRTDAKTDQSVVKMAWALMIGFVIVLPVVLYFSDAANYSQQSCDCSSAIILAEGGSEAVTYGGSTFLVADSDAAEAFLMSPDTCILPRQHSCNT